jgi:cyclase
LRPRIIPVLQLDRTRRLVKTVRFGERTYIGDPFNVIRLFNEKEVDEIVVLDIDATIDGRKPDPGFIRELATECFMPLSYGGGLSDSADCYELGRIGVEKFVIGSAVQNLNFISALARSFGAQAVIGCIDVGQDGACCIRSGHMQISRSPLELAQRLQNAGCGEIILQSIDRDGTRAGYDLDLIRSVSSALNVPLIALGGAGEYEHLATALAAGASAAASGSAFIFIGRLRAVLVTYPPPTFIDGLALRLDQGS